MATYKSEDIKKMNSLVLLKKLYENKSATMLELVQLTKFSQSAVRSILRDLEAKGLVCLEKIDHSTGGRCPGRYTFVQERTMILSVFIDEGSVLFQVVDGFQQELYQEHIQCELDERLESMIMTMVETYNIKCISIASSGVIQEDCFYTDQGETMTKHEIAIHLKQRLQLPVIIENDVKCMMMGRLAKHTYEHLAYVYMSDTGVGSAYAMHQQMMKGHQSFSGEVGLLPFQGQTINEVIASQPSLAILEAIYIQILTTIAVTIDPEAMIIAGKKLSKLSLERIKKGIQDCVSKRYCQQIFVSTHAKQDALDGLQYLGMLAIFDQITDYERGK